MGEDRNWPALLEGRDWSRVAGASEEAIDRLRAAASVTLPESYLSFLAFSDGGEGPIPEDPYDVILDPVDELIDAIEDGVVTEYPGYFVIGGNGGMERIAFDLRGAEPYPLIYFDPIAGIESAEPLAPSFDALVEFLGIDSEDDGEEDD